MSLSRDSNARNKFRYVSNRSSDVRYMPDVSEHIVSHRGRQRRRGHHSARRILTVTVMPNVNPMVWMALRLITTSPGPEFWPPCRAVIGSVTDGTVPLSSYGHVVQSPIRSRQRLRKVSSKPVAVDGAQVMTMLFACHDGGNPAVERYTGWSPSGRQPMIVS